MNYPDKELTSTSRYSYEEICRTLDKWRETEAHFDAAINAVHDYSALPEKLRDEINWLEPIECPMDGVWHRAGNPERYPVAKWKKLIRQHERLIARLQNLD